MMLSTGSKRPIHLTQRVRSLSGLSPLHSGAQGCQDHLLITQVALLLLLLLLSLLLLLLMFKEKGVIVHI